MSDKPKCKRGPKPQIPLDTYNFIVEFKRRNDGCSPALSDIINAGLAGSTSVAAYQVARLVQAGLLTIRGGNKARQICVTGATWTPPPGWVEPEPWEPAP